MYHIARDRRELNSADKLVSAAEHIVVEEKSQKLTVSLLSKEAGVSRTTFYRLFDEPDDVLRYGADERFRRIVKGYVDLIKRASEHDLSVPTPMRWYEEAVIKNVSILTGMVAIGKGDILKEAHKKALREFADVLFPDLSPTSDEFIFFIEMRAGLFLSCLAAAVETGRMVTLDEVQRYAAQQIAFFAGE